MSSYYSVVVEALNENSVSKMQLAFKRYQRVEVGLLTSLIQFDENGETPLLIAMRKRHYSVVDELMLKIKNSYRVVGEYRQLCSLAIQQLILNHIPIVELLDHFIEEAYHIMVGVKWLDFILESCTRSSSVTREEKIVVLELVGAYFIITSVFDSYSRKTVLDCWIKAMALRDIQAEGSPPCPKIPVPSLSAVSRKVFGSFVEATSFEQVLSLLNSPANEIQFENLQIQALLVLRRISRQFSHGPNPCWIYLKSLLSYGTDCYLQQNYNLAINIGLLILEQMTGFDPKITYPKLARVYDATLSLMSSCFMIMLRESPNSSTREELTAANVLLCIKFCTTIAHFFPTTQTVSQFSDGFNFSAPIWHKQEKSVHVYRFVFILGSIAQETSIQEQEQLEECLQKYIRLSFQDGKSNILHAAVRHLNKTTPIPTDELQIIYKTIKLFLKLEADPSDTDETGQTPLFILAGIFKLHCEWCVAVFQDLIDAGAHLDNVESDGKTVVGLLSDTLKKYENGDLIAQPYFDSLTKSVFPLKCYCARVIHKLGIDGIRYDEDRLPLTVQKFVSRHSTGSIVD